MSDAVRLAILIERLEDAYRRQRVAHLKPDTALILARCVRLSIAKPTREAIARALCSGGELKPCAKVCTACKGRANLIMRVMEGRG